MPREHGESEGAICALCGVKVGVYEPAVFVHARWVVRTSRGQRPDLLAAGDTRIYHEACYGRAQRADDSEG